MNERQVLDIILSKLRRAGLEKPMRQSRLEQVLHLAALRIVRQAARVASQAGAMVTHGRTRL